MGYSKTIVTMGFDLGLEPTDLYIKQNIEKYLIVKTLSNTSPMKKNLHGLH